MSVHLSVQDTLNDRSTAAVEALLDGRWEGSRQGRDAKHVVMLTGDNPASANRIARLVGISDVRAVRQHRHRIFLHEHGHCILCTDDEATLDAYMDEGIGVNNKRSCAGPCSVGEAGGSEVAAQSSRSEDGWHQRPSRCWAAAYWQWRHYGEANSRYRILQPAACVSPR